MRIALALLAPLLVAFVPPNYRAKAGMGRTRGVPVTILSSGDMYDLINTIDCLAWPSEEIKAQGGKSGWNGWLPTNGESGVAFARSKHCFQATNVIFVKVSDHYVPMAEYGISVQAGSLDDLPMLTK